MSKPKLSEIKAREQAASEYTWYPDAMEAVFRSYADIPHLLKLVERLGKVIDATTVWCGDDPCYRTKNGVPQRMPAYVERVMKEVRALLLEIKE